MYNLAMLQSRLDRNLGKRDALKEDCTKLEAYIAEMEDKYITAESARIIGMYLTERGREEIKHIFDSIGSSALKAVFGDEAEFSVEYRRTDNDNRQAHLRVKHGNVVGDPLEKSGNSAAAILSTVLRRAVIILDPSLRNVLIADEPLSGIDEGKMSDIASIDREMVDAQDMQLIIVTHDGKENYIELSDVVIEVTHNGEYSEISYLKQQVSSKTLQFEEEEDEL